jgi:hypothetical protein
MQYFSFDALTKSQRNAANDSRDHSATSNLDTEVYLKIRPMIPFTRIYPIMGWTLT